MNIEKQNEIIEKLRDKSRLEERRLNMVVSKRDINKAMYNLTIKINNLDIEIKSLLDKL